MKKQAALQHHDPLAIENIENKLHRKSMLPVNLAIAYQSIVSTNYVALKRQDNSSIYIYIYIYLSLIHI